MSMNLLEWLRDGRARRLVSAGDRSRSQRNWEVAADYYLASLRLRPDRDSIHVQHGNMLKEAGDWSAAEAAYCRALALEPENADTWLQLGHVLKLLGRAQEAVEAYKRAAFLAPDLHDAAIELVALGGPESGFLPSARREAELGSAMRGLSARVSALQAELRPYVASARSYAAFRQMHPVTPPPAGLMGTQGLPIDVWIDARGRIAAELAATLDTLRDQIKSDWRAYCTVDQDLMDHPVASITHFDTRVSFQTGLFKGCGRGRVVILSAGTVLDPSALCWFDFVHGRTGCAASYADHDHVEEGWRKPRIGHLPTLQPIFDPDWFADGLSAPAAICCEHEHLLGIKLADFGIMLCSIAEQGGLVIHVPRLLSSILDVISVVRDAPHDPQTPPVPLSLAPIKTSRAAFAPASRIGIIVPTRDQSEMLTSGIESLLATAANRQRLDIVIVDNRSCEDRTQIALENLKARFGVSVQSFDEPFNWSRVNNFAVRETDTDLLFFLNNDTEMLTQDWDNLLEHDLARAGIGAMGARLLYPDRTVQHAGIIFGTGDGAPRHEGVGSSYTDAGPDGRWLRRRSVAAVTGACLAMRRSVWEEVGGFDEELAVGYNDVDMAIRIRSRGYRILYAANLQLIHHESKTRGLNITRSQVAWDRQELRTLHEKWGDLLFHDPALNLHWSRNGDTFATFEEPTLSAILAEIDQSTNIT